MRSPFEDGHQECANLCLKSHEDEIHSNSNLDHSLEELYDTLNGFMKEYKKLKRRNKDINALNQNLNERLNLIIKEKDYLIKENQDSPYWYKDFFEYVVAPNLELFKWIIPLGEIAIGLALILGVLSYTASFFGVFIMLNYILADMIFTYPTQLFFFIILLMNKETMKTLSLSHFLKRTTGKD